VIFLIFLLSFIEIDVYHYLITTKINQEIYFYVDFQDQPVYYILMKKIYLVSNATLIDKNWYLVNEKFVLDQQPIFFQIEKSISLMSYLFKTIFKI
jgi:hypothetical protein